MTPIAAFLFCVAWTLTTKVLLIVGVSVMLAAVIGLLVLEILGKRDVLTPSESDEDAEEEQEDEGAEEEPEDEEEEDDDSDEPEETEETDEPEEFDPANLPVAADYQGPAEDEDEPDDELELAEGAVVVDDAEGADTGVMIVNGESVKVQYNRSFQARLIQADDILKSRYSALRNELLRYELKPRPSWANESYYRGRTTYAKFAIRGKTLSLCLALKPEAFAGTKYTFTDMGNIGKYKAVPMRLKLKSDRSVRWAKELIAAMSGEYGWARIDRAEENFRPEYRDTTTCVLQRLIKLSLVSDSNYSDEQWEDAVVADLKLRDRAPREFLGKLMRSSIALKTNYSAVKNELLRYGLKSRMSKSNESFFKGRTTYAKFAIRGKNLSLYLALNPAQFQDTKYIFTNVGDVSKYAAVPMRLKLKSDRSVRWAKELIFAMAKKDGFKHTDLAEVDYRYVLTKIF